MLLFNRKISAIPSSFMAELDLLQCKFEYWGAPGNAYGYFQATTTAILNGWTGAWDEYIYKLHELKGDKISREQCGWIIYNILITTLED